MNHTALYDIYDMKYSPWWQQPWSWALIMTIVAIIPLVFWMWMKFLKLTPAQKALKSIKKIRPHDACTQEHHKQFYSLLSGIIKEFFAEQFRHDTIGMTDDEFKKFLVDYHFPLAVQKEVGELFDGITYVKFAAQNAAQKKIIDDYDRVKRIIAYTQSSTSKREYTRGA